MSAVRALSHSLRRTGARFAGRCSDFTLSHFLRRTGVHFAGKCSGGSAGFTLLEALAALAIAAVIIVATAGLVSSVARHFDRGTRSVTGAEHLMLAVDRLARDFGAARFVQRTGEDGTAKAAFLAEPAKIVFVSGGGIGAGPQGEEVVTLTIEDTDAGQRLVRRRAAWLGPRMRLEDATPQDPVVLVEGRLDIAFAFARKTPEGPLAWGNAWTGESSLPRAVRLILRDHASGADVLAEANFLVRADAAAVCNQGDGNTPCLASASAKDASAENPPGRRRR